MYSPKRAYEDAYANLYNDETTRLCGWNSNIVTGCDGGSAMYCTCYVGKGTQEEDNEAFASSAKCMVSSTSRKVKQLEDEGKDINVINEFKMGMASLIGSCIMATKAHTCSATLGAFLTRRKSRFGYSHDFQWTSITNFYKESITDNVLINNGNNYFIASGCSTYIKRGIGLNDTNLYDFLQGYNIYRRSENDEEVRNQDLEWVDDYHGVKENMVLKQNKRRRIPLINCYDFIDTSTFHQDIMSAEYTEVSTVEEEAMESYCRAACTLFIPFRDVLELLDENGLFLGTFKRKFKEFEAQEGHPVIEILTNIQNCRNGLKSGRPRDPLENQTENRFQEIDAKNRKKGKTLNEIEAEKELSGLSMDEYIKEYQNLIPQTPNTAIYRNDNNELMLSSKVIRASGVSQCGYKYLSPPDMSGISVLTTDSPALPVPTNDVNVLPRKAKLSVLYNLCITKVQPRTRIVEGAPEVATGTLDDIQFWGEVLFSSDKYQKKAFEIIVCFFVLAVYDSAENDNINTRKRKIDNECDKLRVYIGNKLQLLMFLSGAGGSGKSRIINAIIKYAKAFCKSVKILFDNSTIIITAPTGVAAVHIGGETAHKALDLCCRQLSEETAIRIQHCYLLIVDEISFGCQSFLTVLNSRCRQAMLSLNAPFGGMNVLFSGDMSQLPPVTGKPLYKDNDFALWMDTPNTFVELKTQWRFKDDKPWGELLSRFREKGPTKEDYDVINSRVIDSPGGPTEADIPANANYACHKNVDRCAINDGIFMKVIEQTHNKNPTMLPPKTAICIKASNMRFRWL